MNLFPNVEEAYEVPPRKMQDFMDAVRGRADSKTLVINLCNSVEEKPDFCPFFTGFTDIHRKSARRRNKIIYFLIILVIVINVLLFFMCKAYIIEKINSRVTSGNIDIDGRINNVIKNYFSLKNSSNDYKAFDDKKGSSPQVIEMHEGSVNTV